jgi:hypothetical protein
MAHLFIAQPTIVELPVFFNVDGVVGASPAMNNREDVLLVQFAFQMIARHTKPNREELQAVARTVKITGTADIATINAIVALQHFAKTKQGRTGQIVDGRVSPAKGYSYGAGFYWTIVYLNDAIQDFHVDIWPRIDKIPGCPPELQAMVFRTVAGK